MSKRIPALRWDDEYYEGKGHSIESATRQAIAEYQNYRERVICQPIVQGQEYAFDLFHQVLVIGSTGEQYYRVILRKR